MHLIKGKKGKGRQFI